MHESVMFPVAYCQRCGSTQLAGRDLDASGAWVHRCVRCDHQVEPPDRRFSVTSVTALGYTFDEDDGGCGGGGCSSCASRSS